VAFILAKFQQANGNESKVIRIKNADKYGIDEFYKEYGLFVAPEDLIYKSIEEARKADIIHIHSLEHHPQRQRCPLDDVARDHPVGVSVDR
jgi:hypothetical protein